MPAGRHKTRPGGNLHIRTRRGEKERTIQSQRRLNKMMNFMSGGFVRFLVDATTDGGSCGFLGSGDIWYELEEFRFNS